MGSMKNLKLRILISELGLTYKDIARNLGISREWLSRLMRYDLSNKNYERIMDAIQKLKETKED